MLAGEPTLLIDAQRDLAAGSRGVWRDIAIDARRETPERRPREGAALLSSLVAAAAVDACEDDESIVAYPKRGRAGVGILPTLRRCLRRTRRYST